MSVKLVYGAVQEHPRKAIHVVRVLDDRLGVRELDDIADRMRARALTRYGEQAASVVIVQGDSKETLQLYGEPYAVTRARAAMFNAAIRWTAIDLD